jgi:hypothetical protein
MDTVNNKMLEMFQVEELEERLENSWGSDDCECNRPYQDAHGQWHDNWVSCSCDARNQSPPEAVTREDIIR